LPMPVPSADHGANFFVAQHLVVAGPFSTL
jgi:hypothetical protein